jgi:hypothetical protein
MHPSFAPPPYYIFVPGYFINISQPLPKRTAYLKIVKILIFPLPFSGGGGYTVVWPQNILKGTVI